MVSVDVRFSGSVPANYERYLVPLLFRPYAEELAARAKQWQPRRILETACGTGVVTDLLARTFPDADIVATDLNQAMLDIAATRVASSNVAFQEADALELPFADDSFDLVICQFGAMFYPDKVRGGVEARRVLGDGGHYLLAIWDRIERNALSYLAYQAMEQIFPDNPPQFMTRGPYSYYEPEWIEAHLEEAGFDDINIETVERMSRSPSAADAARGLVYGSPMGVELADYGENALDLVFNRLADSARQYEGEDGFAAPMVAHIVTSRR
jgi:ubiquinone/menaquinone biosynthesis C-methylase UbiE